MKRNQGKQNCGGRELVVTRDPRGIESLRVTWEKMQRAGTSQVPNTDIDMYISEIKASDCTVQPYIMLFKRNGCPETILIGLIKNELTWSWGQEDLDGQHHPTLLQNGNVLIFDNGARRKCSRIIELNPVSMDIVWEYRSEALTNFYSKSRNSSQRLPNGNTLITESDNGRVFEITNEGEIVWEFYNPDIDVENKRRAAIYRMKRIINPKRFMHLEKFL